VCASYLCRCAWLRSVSEGAYLLFVFKQQTADEVVDCDWSSDVCSSDLGLHYEDAHYLDVWRKLEADPETFEVKRNLPLRHPLLWVSENEADSVSETGL